MTARATALLVLLIIASAAPSARAHDNTDRYPIVRSALSAPSLPTGHWSSGLAGVAFDSPSSPFTFTAFDTPARRSFGPLAGLQLMFGTIAGGLGTGDPRWALGAPCVENGHSYGIMTELGALYSSGVALVSHPGCATNTHLMYQQLLMAVRNCGERCFVDVADLGAGSHDIEIVKAALAGAMQAWAVGKPATARLVLRITIGFVAAYGGFISTQTDFFRTVVQNAGGRVEVYGIAITSGASFAGTWSHAKMFGVYDVTNASYLALIGGQNHWSDYDRVDPPYDANTMLTARAAVLPAMQLDAAIARFNQGRAFTGRAVLRSPLGVVHAGAYQVSGFANSRFVPFSGLTNLNPGATSQMLTVPNQRVIVSMVDMGNYSSGALGRTISRTLAALTESEPWETDIRIFGQQICRGDPFGNCSRRNQHTVIGELVARALFSARIGRATSIRVLTSGVTIANNPKEYASATVAQTRNSLAETGFWIACTWHFNAQNQRVFAYRPGWEPLAQFDNPGGRGSCGAAVVRALRSRFRWRTATAFFSGPIGRQNVGIHHKVIMFGREAMFEGSFNFYQSGMRTDGPLYDSQLVENGALFFDPAYVAEEADNFDEAWTAGVQIIGG